MVSKRLVEEIERNSDKLAIDLVEMLRNDKRAAAYENLTDAQYRTVVRDLYGNLGQWLASRTWNKLRKTYELKGRERFHGGMPLEQLLFSLCKTKQLLLDFIQKSMPGDPSERDQELQLIVAVSDFFDRAMYYTTCGYEDARRTETRVRAEPAGDSKAAAESAAKPYQTDPDEAPSPGDLEVSRGGDVGETAG